jgi:hypothetical protein
MDLVNAKKAQKTMVQALQRAMPYIEKKLGAACIDMAMGPQRPDLCFISWKTHPTLKAPDSVLRIRRYDALGDCILYIEYMHKNKKWDQESMQRIYEDSDMGRDVMGILREIQKFTFVNKPYDLSMGQHYAKLKNVRLASDVQRIVATWNALGVNPYRALSASAVKVANIDALEALRITPAMSLQGTLDGLRSDVAYWFRSTVFAMVAKEIKKDKRVKPIRVDNQGLYYRAASKDSFTIEVGTDSVDGLDFFVSIGDSRELNSHRKLEYQASDKNTVKEIASNLLNAYKNLTANLTT